MLFFANYVHDIFENDEIEINDGDISLLTAIFFLFTFLAATQDIAVDGWGLTILSKYKQDFFFLFKIKRIPIMLKAIPKYRKEIVSV